MKIELKTIKIRELVDGFEDREENGVVGYGGKLDIRPPYQREFVYDDKQQEAVIDTVTKGFPLNTMYWVVRDDGRYEVLDGQQRTISICNYYKSKFAFFLRYYSNLQPDEKEQFLNYELQVYFCQGTETEKLKWFETINIAGEKLTEQEIRNAVYAGSWTSDAKKIFSKSNCAAKLLASDYVVGSPIRQELLEKAIAWNAGKSDEAISGYMALHQHDSDAQALWVYFQKVIGWVKTIFPKYRREMKGVEWGDLYNRYHEEEYNPNMLEEEVSKLMADEDVTNKKGIYAYLFDGEEKHLNIRAFDLRDKRTAFEKQGGVCPLCGETFAFEEMEGDHITPWHLGGKTVLNNLQMICKNCNRTKSGR